MKIAITGHTAGIGKAFAEQLAQRGHSIVGISRREGEKHTTSPPHCISDRTV
jgi:short-subunit dehydrogenase